MIFVEGKLEFEFSDNWQVFKLDDEPDYRSRIGKLDCTKAVDFVGVFKKEKLYFIEVKDFRGYRIENKDRLQNKLLPTEIGQKVRDSVACIIGAYRTSNSTNEWHQFVNLLRDKQKQVFVVVWLEYDLPNHPKQQVKTLAGIGTDAFRPKIGWLTPRVMLANIDEFEIPDLQVRYRKQTV